VGVSVALLTTQQQSLTLMPAIGLVLVMLVAYQPSIGLYAIIALIPFWGFRQISPSMPQLQVHWLFALLLIVILAFQQSVRKALPRTLQANIWGPFALFVLISLFAALLSPYRATAMASVLRLGLAGVFIALILVLVSAHGLKQTLPAVLILSVSLSTLLAILGYFFEIQLFAENIGFFMRGVGGARGPVNLAFMIVAIMPLLGYWLIFERGSGKRLLALSLISLNLLGLVITFSRGGFLILIVISAGMLLEFAPLFRLRHVLLLFWVTVLFVAVAFPLVPESYWSRMRGMHTARDRSSQRRLSYYEVGWKAIQQRPLLGSGPGTFRNIYAKTDHARHFARKDRQRFRDAHNSYLELLVSTGIFGLAAYLLLLGVGLSNFGRARRIYRIRGQTREAALIGAYRLSFLSVLFYGLLKSGVDNKLLLLGLALSVVARHHAAGDTPD